MRTNRDSKNSVTVTTHLFDRNGNRSRNRGCTPVEDLEQPRILWSLRRIALATCQQLIHNKVLHGPEVNA